MERLDPHMVREYWLAANRLQSAAAYQDEKTAGVLQRLAETFRQRAMSGLGAAA